MSTDQNFDFITKELHLMVKEFAEMGKLIAVLDVRSKIQDKNINDLIVSNKEILQSMGELGKAILESKLEDSKRNKDLWIKVTAVYTTITITGGGILVYVFKKILIAGL